MPRHVIVIGAGIVGAAVAYELARRGARVDVIDVRAPGQGATQASGGILAPFIEGHSTELRELTGEALSRYDAFIDRLLTSGPGNTIAYGRTGTLQVATSRDQLDALAAAATSLDALGVENALLDADEVRRREPALARTMLGGLLIPAHGYVAPDQLLDRLVSSATERGAMFRSTRRVRRLASTAGAVTVETDDGALSAPHVVLATGGWSAQIAIDDVPSLPVQPVKGQLLHLRWDGEPMRAVVWGARCYLVPWPDGTLLCGGTVEDAGFDERATAAAVRELLDAMLELVDTPEHAMFTSARVGLRPGSPDERPLVGPSSMMPGLFYAVGHYRNGVMLAPLTAEVAADYIVDGRSDPMLELMRPQRFGER